jgi:type III secretory pathway component EscT
MSPLDLEYARIGLVALGIGSVRLLLMLLPLQVLVSGLAPQMIVSVLALCVQLPVAAAYDLDAVASMPPLALAGHLAAEAMLGLGLGALLMGPVLLVESAGALIENQIGANFASSVDPASKTELAPFGMLMGRMFMLAFLLGGGLQQLIGLYLGSLAMFPPLQAWDGFSLPVQGITAAVSAYLALTVKFALPALIFLLLVDLWLSSASYFGGGLLQDFTIGFALKGAILLVFMAAYADVLVHGGLEWFERALKELARMRPERA